MTSNAHQKKKSEDKLIGLFWLFILVCVLVSAPFWLPNYLENNRNEAARREEAKSIIDNCKGSKETGTEILTYDTYYDSGNNALPVCRLPISAEEKKEMYRARAYREGLNNGSITPDEPDIDNCTGRVCN